MTLLQHSFRFLPRHQLIRCYSTNVSNLQKRAVAGSFIFRYPDDEITKKPEVALFRRSGKVDAYQHKYAPISGKVEETDSDPLAAARRELQEETSLTAISLRLFRQGKPYSFTDESVEREWTIHPFAFILKSEKDGGQGEAGIKLDWEHQGYKWFDPDQVSESDSFGGVPKLLESFRRVWFNIDLGEEAGRVLGDGLLALQRDHESGARQLATKALDIYIDVIQRLDTSSRDAWIKNVKFAGWHLWKNGRESMGAPILNCVLSSLSIIEKSLYSRELSARLVEQVVDTIKAFAQQRQNNRSLIGTSFASFLNDYFPRSENVRIMTLSSSSTVSHCLTHALNQGSRLDLQILESRPMFKAVTMAKKIAALADARGHNVNITIPSDASAATAARDVDVILISADMIDQYGNVTNRTGSLPAVLAARHTWPNIMVVALSEKEKIFPFSPPSREENDANELAASWGELAPEPDTDASARISVQDISWETVPSELIDYYVIENEIMTTEGIVDWAGSVRDQANQHFENI